MVLLALLPLLTALARTAAFLRLTIRRLALSGFALPRTTGRILLSLLTTLSLTAFFRAVFASRAADFIRQFFRGLLQLRLSATQRFGFAAEDRVGRLFNALPQLFDSLSSRLFGLL